MKKGEHHTEESKQRLREANVGKEISVETRRRMSIAHQGKRFSEEHRRNLSEALKGNRNSLGKQHALGYRHTKEAKRKMSAAQKGRKHTAKTLQKMSIIKIGANNPSWKGGISSEPYPLEFNAALHREIKKRDEYQCQTCRMAQLELDEPLHVHHVDGDKQNSSLDNLQTLCRSCHAFAHRNKRKVKVEG